MRNLLTLFTCVLLLAPLPTLAVGLNDTGIGFCGDETTNSANCTTVFVDTGTHPGQDARYGRDAAAAAGKLPKVGGGEASFDFTALDASGQPTTPGSGTNPHHCVRDNVSGLVWEVKTDDNGLHDKDWTYSWYNSNSSTNGGNAGSASGGTCQTAGHCDTEKYVADVNASALGAYTDWRMPTDDELQSIVHYGRTNPTIDPTYFPNTPSSGFWSGSPDAYGSSSAWCVYFSYGFVNSYYRYDGYSIRVVRGGQ